MSIVDQSTAVTANSTGVLIASSASVDTKGAWVPMIETTSEETYWIQLVITNNVASVTKRNFLVDIGVGAIGLEVVKIANVSAYVINSKSITYLFPLTIASGSRVSISCANGDASATSCFAMIYLDNEDAYGTSTVNANFGADTANSIGKTIEADGTTDDTKGGYGELTSSTSIDIDYIVVMIGSNDNGTISPAQEALVDIATGSGPEVDIIANVPYGMNNAETSGISFGVFQSIPSTTRLSARMQTSGSVAAGAVDRRLDVSILGFALVAPSGGGGAASVLGQIGLKGGMQ